MVTIIFPDKSEKKFEKSVSIKEIAESIGPRLAQDALAGEVNGKLVDLNHEVKEDAAVRIITFKDPEGEDIFHHSSSHLMAAAVLKVFPEAVPTIGPAVEKGYYYDYDVPESFSPEDLEKIEAEMKSITKEKVPFVRKEISKEEALELFKGNPYKLEIIKESEDEVISIYENGNFVDLCRGPHVPHTGYIKAFKLTKIAGAYWRGKSDNKMLQRIYGISFPDKKELKKYLIFLEEAAKRDHRKIGPEMDLFSFHEEGPGFPFFHGKGMIVINELLNYWREVHTREDYQENKTPIILSRKLWEQSGHWGHYKENMYFTRIDEQDYAVKPMNCPGGILIYKANKHSYKEFPIKAGEIGIVHRHELSGVLSGLFRVRNFTQDDAHIFMLPEQIPEQIQGVMNIIDEMYSTFGFEYHIELSTRPEKAMGSQEMWDNAENALKLALDKNGKPYKINEGDGAFYGPKIDFHIKDCLGRTWQCATIQLDFSMPEKFDLTYMGEDGTENHRPVMIHRVVYGSLERFFGILIEHFAGKFPLWISPEQVRVIPVSERFNLYAGEVLKTFKGDGIRAGIDDRSETVGKKIREAQLDKVNYIIVVGEKEKENKTINIRKRDNTIVGEKDISVFISELKEEIKKKVIG